jgi:hypothetical protein
MYSYIYCKINIKFNENAEYQIKSMEDGVRRFDLF